MSNLNRINNTLIFDRNELFCVTRLLSNSAHWCVFLIYGCIHIIVEKLSFQASKEVIYYIPLRICKALSVPGDNHLLLFLLFSKRI